jgi:hypothetical protein
MKINETWLPVVGFEGQYKVSSTGVVSSLDRLVGRPNKGIMLYKQKQLAIRIAGKNNKGYFQAMLSKNGQRKYMSVHRLVAQAFIPNPENKPQVNHINGIKTDNRIENLEWCTQSENMIHAVNTGLQPHSFGEKRGKSCKLSELKVIEIKHKISQGVKLKDIAKEYSVNPVTISNIKTKATWAHV